MSLPRFHAGRFSGLALPKALAAAGLVLVALAASALASPPPVLQANPRANAVTPFLLRSGEQTGFSVHGHPVALNTVKAFVDYGGGTKQEKATETALLEKGGFVLAASEQLGASHRRQAFSLVMQFTSPASAKAAATYLLASAVQGQKGAKLSHFRVKGVPGARGLAAVTGKVSTANIYWSHGACAFGSGDYVPKNAGPLKAPVIAGVKSLYKRTKGTICS